jgi:hypothetical protein
VKRWLVGIVIVLAVLVLMSTALGSSPAASPAAPTPPANPTSSLAPPSQPTGSGAGASATPGSSEAPSPGASLPAAGTLEPLGALLAMLRVAPEDRTGYQRSLFVHWIDADGDGCDTRHEVLIAEAIVKPTVGASCALTGGKWFSLYDGLTVTDPAKLQIDHVVALAEAWDSGASAWTPARRKAYANDLDVPFALLAVSSATNQSKSDKDPADWLPPALAAECQFIGDWIAVKVRWDLAVDVRERDALAGDIADCRTAEMPFDPAGSDGETGGTPTPAPSPSAVPGGTGTRAGCDPSYPTVCIAPPPPDLDCGYIPYRNFKVLPPDPDRFDGDHDGIGCET